MCDESNFPFLLKELNDEREDQQTNSMPRLDLKDAKYWDPWNVDHLRSLLQEEGLDGVFDQIQSERDKQNEEHIQTCKVISHEPQEVILAIVPQNHRKRGRKSLIEQGLSHEEVADRRRNQNKSSQQRRRDKKKPKISAEYNTNNHIMTGEKLHIIVKALEKVKDRTSDDESEALLHFAIDNLIRLPKQQFSGLINK